MGIHVIVSFDVSFPLPGGSMCISLGVGKVALSYEVVQIKIGTWTQGYKVILMGENTILGNLTSIWKNPKS